MGIEERKKREKEERRDLIVRTAKRLFFEEGFQFVTVEKIAREAELAKGSIYLHFRGKEEIYTQILLRDIDAFYQEIAPLVSADALAESRLVRLAHVYTALFLRDRELFRILMNFQLYPYRLNLPEDLHRSLIVSMKKNIDVVEKIFEQGVQAGEFNARTDLFYCRNAFWGMLNGIISHYLYAAPEEKRGDLIRATLDVGLAVFMRGIK